MAGLKGLFARQSSVEYLIVGLGNPGLQYENTRHNAGFMALDALADQLGTTVRRAKFSALCGEAEYRGHKLLLLKPQTFMNNSGTAVTEAMRFYKIPPQKCILLFDDISLDPGRLRIRRKGSDGGHNGLKDIFQLSGSNDFPRVKIGVGAKPHPEYDLAKWVLSKPDKEALSAITEAAKKAADAACLLVEDQIDQAMERYNH
ncbi:MAG: aminoacyl-tRNA hydrolase [Oscillospiraceae bacterium]|nr:aminoacyl-tRNA hydrolase [Oscillospiraceae bacterium]MBQ8731313.1 aminoacyl-tRNA hydrolase [Oscillospiraceae bacterium]